MAEASRRFHASPSIHHPRGINDGHGRQSRRPRWDTDAGITDRDVAALRWLGQPSPAPPTSIPPPRGINDGHGRQSRRPRWDTDAGITDRDVAALRWLGQQYAAR